MLIALICAIISLTSIEINNDNFSLKVSKLMEFMLTIKKILVIEDDEPMARALEIKLTHAGFKVKSAGNGEDGLVIFFSSQDFSLVLLDLILPKVNGFKVLEKLKKDGNKTPVIVLSNLIQAEDENRLRELGAADFFIKSNTPILKIVERVKETLGVSSASNNFF